MWFVAMLEILIYSGVICVTMSDDSFRRRFVMTRLVYLDSDTLADAFVFKLKPIPRTTSSRFLVVLRAFRSATKNTNRHGDIFW